jgi:hypothetical protein
VDDAIDAVLASRGGFATAAELQSVLTRQQLDVRIRNGRLTRVWRGVYAAHEPDLLGRLAALDVFAGRRMVACMGTAASLYGFDTEDVSTVHVLDPGVRMRPTYGLMVHQRHGAPLRKIAGRLSTAPAWTAIEVARELPRPRALATLDAALRSTACTPAELAAAVKEQAGRRGIVATRELAPLADPRSESAMESEARLLMYDGGVPTPQLQYDIRDNRGHVWRTDFAWPEARLAAEYDSIAWHAGRPEMLRDRAKVACLQEIGWTVVSMTVDDIRYDGGALVYRINTLLSRSQLAG